MPKIAEEGIINTKQFVWSLFVIITSFAALQVPGLVVFQAQRDTWLAVICAWVLDLLLALVYAYMGIRFPGENCVQYSMTIFGKRIGKLLGLGFILFFLIVSSYLMRGLAMYIRNVFLPNTPMEVTLLCAYFTVAYIVRKGIEVIVRMCEILGPIYLLSFIVLFLLALPSVHLDRLRPQLDHGIYPFLSTAPLVLTHFGICIAMGWYIAICNRPENGYFAKFSAVSLGATMIGLLTVLSIGCFGLEQVANMINPGLELTRLIRISDYFGRMEIIWMGIAIGAGILTTITAVWIASLGVAQIAEFSSYKSLVYPIALLSFILCLTSFPTNTVFLNFAFYVFPLIGLLIESGLELLLFLGALISGKKGRLTRLS